MACLCARHCSARWAYTGAIRRADMAAARRAVVSITLHGANSPRDKDTP